MPGRTKEGARVSKLYKLKMQGKGQETKAEEPKVEKKEELKVEEDLDEEDTK